MSTTEQHHLCSVQLGPSGCILGPNMCIVVVFQYTCAIANISDADIYAVWYHHTDRGAIRYIGKLNKKDFVKMTTMNDIVSIVYVLFVVEGVQTGLMTYTAWEILAYNWGDPSILLNIPSSWSSATTPITGGIVEMFNFILPDFKVLAITLS
ncbi:hypothetical protein F5051DRAFT_433249 [Lentinula edodes]|nr:hypothetical protein F5051DRAFT_433249 [Lentinula edodes]